MAKVQVDIKKLIGMIAVAAIVLFGLKLRGDGQKVNDIDPAVNKKGQVLLADVMEKPLIEDGSYVEPKAFSCLSLRDKFLRTPISQLGDIDPQKIITAQCDKVLEKHSQSIIVKKLIACLKESKRSDDCRQYLLYYRAFSIENLIKKDPEILKKNDNVKLHKIVWDLATTSDYKVNEMEALISRIDELLVKHPYLYALHKAKLIYVVIKDIYYPQKVIDDRMYKTWEQMTALREDTRDNWELRMMNVLKHKVFFEPDDMKHWVNNFLMNYPEYYMSYYYYSYFYWEILGDKNETIGWLQAGIEKTQDPYGKLKQQLSKVQSAAAGDKVYKFEFNFEIIHD